jgi:chemotaxis protein methyltransferase CheR
MNANNFAYVTKVLKDASGLALAGDKGYLIESRLGPIARKYGCGDLDDLVCRLRDAPRDPLVREVVEAMTTNESFFFRDIKPFDLFRNEILPEVMRQRAAMRSFRIWCAAASTGQEPYSLAMILHEEAARLAGWHYDIVGTDLSSAVLVKAAAGAYSHFEVQRGLSAQRLIAHFDQTETGWRIKPALRVHVTFRQFNLLDNPRALGQFDVVFCRNVLIYFDPATKSQVLASVSQVTNDDGFLFLGGAETAYGISNAFMPRGDQHGVYRRTAPTSRPLAPLGAAPEPVAIAAR